jgi:hypothetical protein
VVREETMTRIRSSGDIEEASVDERVIRIVLSDPDLVEQEFTELIRRMRPPVVKTDSATDPPLGQDSSFRPAVVMTYPPEGSHRATYLPGWARSPPR